MDLTLLSAQCKPCHLSPARASYVIRYTLYQSALLLSVHHTGVMVVTCKPDEITLLKSFEGFLVLLE